MGTQPIPSVSQDDVKRILRRDYPAEQLPQVMAILDTADNGVWPRVQLAALKLAAGSLEKLSNLVVGADYRDLLSGAEYPGYMKNWDIMDRLPANERQRIIDEDWAQYAEWLYRQ
jgi:hypothetical protein